MGTLIVGIILVAVVAAIIMSLFKNKKNGKSSCGNNCAHCAMSGSCHKKGEVSPSLQPPEAFSATPSPKRQSPLKSPVVTVLHIDGMMCAMCESHIHDAIRNNFAVQSVKASHKTGICEIKSNAPLDEEKVQKVIAETGYTLKNSLS